MARIEKLACSNCGASLEVDLSTQVIECRFCGTRLLFEKDEPARLTTGIITRKHAAEVKQWFEKLGIKSSISDPENEFTLDLRGRIIDPPDLRYLEYFPNATFVNLEDTNLDNAAAPYLEKLTATRHLIISNTGITDLSFVRAMPDLETIRASGTNISDSALGALQHHANMKTLDLDRTLVTIEGLKLVSGLPALKELGYPNTIRDIEFLRNNMIHFAAARSVVNLSCAAVTDQELKALEGVTTIEILDLRSNKITDNALASLQGNFRLNYLDLSHNKITDAGIEHLHVFKRLAHLDLGGTGVTSSGIEKLKTRLPNVKITY